MVIQQGDIFWVDFGEPQSSGPGYPHPHVVIQNDIFNQSRINTVVLCGITSNLNRGEAPGNGALRKGEGNLKKRSVVLITQVIALAKSELREKIGSLSRERIAEIIQGIDLMIRPRDMP